MAVEAQGIKAQCKRKQWANRHSGAITRASRNSAAQRTNNQAGKGVPS